MTTKITPLAVRLGIDESDLAAFAKLTKDQVAALDGAVETAMHAQDEAVEDGFAAALGYIPRPLRGRAAALMGVSRG